MRSFFRILSRLVRKQNVTDTARIRIVSVLASKEDRRLLDEIGKRNHWDVLFADTQEEARRMSDRLKPAIVLFDRDIVGADWRYAVSTLASASAGACVLLISRVADDYLWNEVVSYGGYDLLHKPFSEKDLRHAVKLAWSYWKGRRQSAVLAKK